MAMPQRETPAGAEKSPFPIPGLEVLDPLDNPDFPSSAVTEHETAQPETTVKLIVDTQVCDQLLGPEATLELCDETGRTLGYFVGCFVPSPQALPWAYEWARDAFSEEEIERARQQPGGRTIHEILQRLERS